MITWVSCHDPADGTRRRCTWVGETRRVIVTGMPARFVEAGFITGRETFVAHFRENVIKKQRLRWLKRQRDAR